VTITQLYKVSTGGKRFLITECEESERFSMQLLLHLTKKVRHHCRLWFWMSDAQHRIWLIKLSWCLLVPWNTSWPQWNVCWLVLTSLHAQEALRVARLLNSATTSFKISIWRKHPMHHPPKQVGTTFFFTNTMEQPYGLLLYWMWPLLISSVSCRVIRLVRLAHTIDGTAWWLLNLLQFDAMVHHPVWWLVTRQIIRDTSLNSMTWYWESHCG